MTPGGRQARRVLAAALCASTLTVLLGAARAEPIQSYGTYKSWLVACDNALTCVAKGFEAGSGGPSLRVERDAGPEGALSVRITAESRLALGAVAVDGVRLGIRDAGWTRD